MKKAAGEAIRTWAVLLFRQHLAVAAQSAVGALLSWVLGSPRDWLCLSGSMTSSSFAVTRLMTGR